MGLINWQAVNYLDYIQDDKQIIDTLGAQFEMTNIKGQHTH